MQTRTRDRIDHRPDAAGGDGRTGWKVSVALAAGIAIIAAAAVALWPAGSEPDPVQPLELSLGESGALASCLAFDVAVLADMPVAFLGTATAVEGSQATLTVDRWFKGGGDAGSVTLVAEHTSPALIAGFDITAGEQYLISASNGQVNYCGYSGPATPELLTGYTAAFGG